MSKLHYVKVTTVKETYMFVMKEEKLEGYLASLKNDYDYCIFPVELGSVYVLPKKYITEMYFLTPAEIRTAEREIILQNTGNLNSSLEHFTLRLGPPTEPYKPPVVMPALPVVCESYTGKLQTSKLTPEELNGGYKPLPPMTNIISGPVKRTTISVSAEPAQPSGEAPVEAGQIPKRKLLATVSL